MKRKDFITATLLASPAMALGLGAKFGQVSTGNTKEHFTVPFFPAKCPHHFVADA